MVSKGFDRLKQLQKLNKQKNWLNKDLYRLMYKEDLYIAAYEKIKSKPGNMTPSSDNVTLDGFSLKTIEKIIAQMRSEQFRFKPNRKEGIPKLSGATRYISVAPPRDKIVQQVVLMILECIYDSPKKSYFKETSHGFRANKNPHTALKDIRFGWGGTKWLIEGDLKNAFDTVDRNILESILREKIADERFINLIRKILSAGYMQFNTYYNSIIGVAQGSIISPILFNVYMHKFDVFMEKLCKQFHKGKTRKSNLKYERLSSNKQYLKKKGVAPDSPKIRELIAKMKKIPSLDPMDNDFKRMKYSRFCDDFLIGVIGSKKQATTIRDRIKVFLMSELKLTLNIDKTKITHAKKDKAKFLGFYISIGKGKGLNKLVQLKNQHGVFTFKKRCGEQAIQLKIPVKDLLKKLEKKGYCKFQERNKKTLHNNMPFIPIEVGRLIPLTSQDIVKHYNSVWRGIRNFYLCSDYPVSLNIIKYILKYSCARTLACKYHCSIKKIFRKFGKNLTIKWTEVDSDKNKKVSLDPWIPKSKEKKFMISENNIDRIQLWVNYRSRSHLGKPCIVCGEPNSEMHHVRHIRKMNQKLKGFHKVMASLNRKQVPVCRKCHQNIHQGKYDGTALSSVS